LDDVLNSWNKSQYLKVCFQVCMCKLQTIVYVLLPAVTSYHRVIWNRFILCFEIATFSQSGYSNFCSIFFVWWCWRWC